MANALKKYSNGLSIRFLKKQNKYFITFGVAHIQINGEYSKGFYTLLEAENTLSNLRECKNLNSNYYWRLD